MNIRFQLVIIDTKYRRIFNFYTVRGLTNKTMVYGLRHGHYLPLFSIKDMFGKHPDWFLVGLEDVRGLGLVGASAEDYAAVHWYDPYSSHGSFDVYGEYFGDFRGGRQLRDIMRPEPQVFDIMRPEPQVFDIMRPEPQVFDIMRPEPQLEDMMRPVREIFRD